MIRRLDLPDEQHLAYVDHAPDESPARDTPPLLLLHGGGLDHRMWEPQLAALTTMRRVAPDARGHGDSSTPTRPYRLVDDVVRLLDRLEIDRAVVCGLSMGGGTAVDLAVERPDRVAGLVVSGTGTSDPQFTDPWVLEVFDVWRTAVERRDPELWIDGFLRFLHGPHRDLDDVDPRLVELNDAMVRRTLEHHVLPLVARGQMPIEPTKVDRLNERRASIKAPVLAIIGEADADDHIRFTRELLTLIDDAREVTVADAAHYPNLEAPNRFNDALLSFVGSAGS